MVRKILRRKTLERKIRDKIFPAGIKLDPNGRAVGWFEDVVEAWQKARVEASTTEAA